jgi:hypothetical protein
MHDSLHPLRIEKIKNTSVPFPLFFSNASEDVVQAIYVSEMHEMNAMLVPQSFTIVKESAAGVKTTAIYTLVEAVKTGDDDDDFDPQNN